MPETETERDAVLIHTVLLISDKYKLTVRQLTTTRVTAAPWTPNSLRNEAAEINECYYFIIIIASLFVYKIKSRCSDLSLI
jgi:hypothetical protein